jgi:hypothetical protein
MISAQSTTHMARVFMAAEMFMAAANCGRLAAARARAERLLDEYFALVEQEVPWTENNRLDQRS